MLVVVVVFSQTDILSQGVKILRKQIVQGELVIHFTVLQTLSSELSCSLHKGLEGSLLLMGAKYLGVGVKKSVGWNESPLVNHLSGSKQAEFPSSWPSWGSSD